MDDHVNQVSESLVDKRTKENQSFTFADRIAEALQNAGTPCFVKATLMTTGLWGGTNASVQE